MELNKFIGDRIKRFRESRGMTQDSLAQKLNTTRQSISRYESGERKANQDILFDLADLFNVKVDDFFPPRDIDSVMTSENAEDFSDTNVNLYDFFDVGIAAGAIEQIDRIYLEDDDVEQIEIADVVLGKYAGRIDIFFTRINGDSMNKIIPNHSLIAVKRIEEVEDFSNDDLVLFSYQNGFSVKRFFNDSDSKQLIFSPESTRRDFHDIVIPYEYANELKILGKVVMYIVNLD